jgi:pilus assembly protein CpaB
LKIIIALVAGLFAVIIALGYLQAREAQLIGMAAPVNIVVTTQDLPPGHVVTEQDLRIEAVPSRYAQPGNFNDLRDVIDRIVVVALLEGEQVTASKVAFAGVEPLAAKLPAGMRGVTMAVTAVSGVAGLPMPGDYVDVVGIFELGSRREDVITQARFMLQNVLVAAVDRNTGSVAQASDESPAGVDSSAQMAAQTVTLALQPEDAQRLILAQELGRLFVLLRSSRETEGVLAFELLDAQKLLDSDLPVWTPAMEEAEFRRQLLQQIR